MKTRDINVIINNDWERVSVPRWFVDDAFILNHPVLCELPDYAKISVTLASGKVTEYVVELILPDDSDKKGYYDVVVPGAVETVDAVAMTVDEFKKFKKGGFPYQPKAPKPLEDKKEEAEAPEAPVDNDQPKIGKIGRQPRAKG